MRKQLTPLVDLKSGKMGLGGIFGIRKSKIKDAPKINGSCSYGRSWSLCLRSV